MEWLSIAKNLAVNRKQRIDCDCGKGKTLVVNHFPDKYSAYCFRCDYDEFEYKGDLTLKELAHIKELNEIAENYDEPIKLPEDFSDQIPQAGRLLLYRAGLSPSVWKEYGIGYSETYERIVLPVYDEAGDLVWLQQRAIHKQQKPKYIQPSSGRDSIVFRGHRSPDNLRTVITVEDIFSGIRVGKFADTFALLGTKLSDAQATLLSRYDRVVTWMDGDKAGISGASSIRKTMGLVVDVDNIQTTVDPKALSNQSIQEILRCKKII